MKCMEFDQCFVCGQANERGMKLKLHRTEDGQIVTRFEAEGVYQGWPGILHGGVISSVLDEATAYVTLHMGLVAVTAEMSVAFHKPVRVGERMQVCARATHATRRVVEVKAELRDETGDLRAESTAKMVILTDRQKGRLGLESVM